MSKEMYYCAFCGKRLAPNATFCAYCGKQIHVDQSQNNDSYPSHNTKNDAGKSNASIFVAIIVLFFVGFGLKYVLGDGNSDAVHKSNNTSSTNKNAAVAPVNYSGWKTISIGEVASLQYPPTMEVQNDKYRSITGSPTPGNNDIHLQQYGLNDMTPEGRSRYARVLFNTKNSDVRVSLYEKLKLTRTELDELNTTFYDSLKPEMKMLSGKILTKEPTQVKTINGIDCLYNTYTRQLKNNPVVIVHSYHFFNNQYIHQIKISYRESEKTYWTAQGNDIRNVVNTLKIKAF